VTEPNKPEPNHDSLVNISIHIFYSPDLGYLAECQHCDWSYAYQDRALLEAEGQLHLRSHPEYIVVEDIEDEDEKLKQIEQMIETFAAGIVERCGATDHDWLGQTCAKCGYTLPSLADMPYPDEPEDFKPEERKENTDD